MAPEPRAEILALRPTVHGGSADAGVLDFSTGVSPFAPPPEILVAARAADLSRYPHATALPFRAAAAELHGVSPEHVVAGAGSVELIWALARAFGGPGRAGLVVTPAFGEYEQALRASGADVVTVRLAAPRFELSPAALERALADDGHITIVFVCRPSNPCLTSVPAPALMELTRRWPGTLFVIDEAYQPLFDEAPGLSVGPNVALLRSLTKVFALPGLRLGYLLASAEVARVVQLVLPPWNVSSPAQAAGVVAAASYAAALDALRAGTSTLRLSLKRTLAELAGEPAQSGGPFLLYRVGAADDLAGRMLDQGVKIRSCASFGLPEHVRLGIRPEDEHEALLRAWRLATV